MKWLKEHRKPILKGLLATSVVAALAVGGYFILKACGLTGAEFFARIEGHWWTWPALCGLQFLQCAFVPVSNQLITIPASLAFGDSLWKVFLSSWLGIWLATLCLYWLGRTGGRKVAKWLIGNEEDEEKCLSFLKRGWWLYPIGMLLPIPDDVLTTVAGASGIPFWFVACTSLVTRAVDAACSVFGFGILTKFWWGYIVLGCGIILLVALTFLFHRMSREAGK